MSDYAASRLTLKAKYQGKPLVDIRVEADDDGPMLKMLGNLVAGAWLPKVAEIQPGVGWEGCRVIGWWQGTKVGDSGPIGAPAAPDAPPEAEALAASAKPSKKKAKKTSDR